MRYLVLLLLAFTGCASTIRPFWLPARRPRPGEPAISVSSSSFHPIRAYGSAPADETKYLLSGDEVRQVQVHEGQIIASESVPGGLPAIEAELFEKASAEQHTN